MADIKGKAPQESGAKSSPASQGINCLVAKGTRIEGQFSAAEDTRIDGAIKGEVKCERKLVTGDGSLIEGKVWAAEAVFMGAITGDIVINGHVQLTPSAVITGTLTAKTLSVDEGAQLNGTFKIA